MGNEGNTGNMGKVGNVGSAGNMGNHRAIILMCYGVWSAWQQKLKVNTKWLYYHAGDVLHVYAYVSSTVFFSAIECSVTGLMSYLSQVTL